jgi:two-component system LytT family response regulator
MKYLLYVPLRTAIDPSYDVGVAQAISADFLGKLMFFWAAIGILHAVFFYQRGQVQARLAAELALSSERPQKGGGRDRVSVLARSGFPVVAPEEIDWIEASGNYALIHAGARRHLVRETMTALSERLDPEAFVRVHRSAIVNVAAIFEAQPAARGRYQLTLRNGKTLSTGRSFKMRVQALLH